MKPVDRPAALASSPSPWRAMMPRGADGRPLVPVPAESFVRSSEPPVPPSPETGRVAAAGAAAGAVPGPASVALRVVLLGPPGSGKSTQGRLLAERLGVPHVSTGDLVRQEIASGSEVGRRMEGQVKEGGLAESGLVAGLVRARLSQPDAAGGFILDGFPRQMDQVPLLEDLREGLGWGPVTVLGLEVPREESIQRLSQRGRADDTPETVLHRLEVYEAETKPVVTYYRARGEYLGVDGTGTIEDVAARLGAAVAAPARR